MNVFYVIKNFLQKTSFTKMLIRIIHMRNVMPKFQSCRLNGVATIEIIQTDR